MKAVGYERCLPVTEPQCLVDIELPKPVAVGRDMLVKVEAVSVNPVDTKIRKAVAPESDEFKILGWDVCGVVEAVGEQVTLFKPGDQVWYAGAINRSGCNAEYHLVDERIVAHKPASLDVVQAAALPLTAITAWEMLFDRFGLTEASEGHLLVIGAAGGVGSIMIQLAKKLTKLKVIATASRAESEQWVKALGADYVIDHQQAFAPQLQTLGLNHIEYVAGLTHTAQHLPAVVELIAPQGKFGVIDDPGTLDIMPFKRKSVSIHWEFMYTRSLFTTDDMIEQHHLLSKVATLIDSGVLKTTLAQHFGAISAANLIKAHTLIESAQSRGKIVLSGF